MVDGDDGSRPQPYLLSPIAYSLCSFRFLLAHGDDDGAEHGYSRSPAVIANARSHLIKHRLVDPIGVFVRSEHEGHHARHQNRLCHARALVTTHVAGNLTAPH